MKTTIYDKRYQTNELYWSFKPSGMLYKAIELLPVATHRLKALDIGCGEGASAIFLARNGFDVTAFDLSPNAVQKTIRFADQLNLSINAFVADLNNFEVRESYDLIFSSGTIQYLYPNQRPQFIEGLKQATNPNGLNVLQTFIKKPFVAAAPDRDENEFLWTSGELLTCYQDWKTEYFIEEIKPCQSGGIPHEHAHNRIWTRKN